MTLNPSSSTRAAPIPDSALADPGAGKAVASLGAGAAGIQTMLLLTPTVTLAGDAASIDFPNLPQIDGHLLILSELRTDEAATQRSSLDILFNGDTTIAHYINARSFAVTGPTVSTDGNAASAQIMLIPGDGADANIFSTGEIRVPGYISGKLKRARSTYGTGTTVAATQWALGQTVTTWVTGGTAAISRVTLQPSTGGVKLRAGSSASVYLIAR